MKSSCLPGSALMIVLFFDMIFSLLFNSCGSCLITTAAGIGPAAGQCIAILAKLTFVISGRSFFSTPDDQYVAFHFIDVIQGHAIQVAVEAGLDLCARFRTECKFVTDDL